jgi:hypothetical protein
MTVAEEMDVAIKAGGLLVAFVGAIVAAVKYFDEQAQSRDTRRDQQEKDRELRREELAWRKTQFIVELAQNLESDEHYRRALQMILVGASLPTGSTLASILGPETADALSPAEKLARYDIDRYLDFFDRLHSFAMEIHSLSPQDIRCFTWYVTHVRDVPELSMYAKREGYDDVLALADELDKLRPGTAIPHAKSSTRTL